MNTNIILLRFSQILLVGICMLRELINCITDMEQYHNTVSLFGKITSFPTQANASLVWSRSISISNSILNHLGPILLILAHVFVFLLLLYGVIVLLRHIRTSDFKLYNSKKFICTLGLCLGLMEYFFLYGFLAMDYFLSWMQQINYNSDILGYSWPLGISLLYLSLKDFQEIGQGGL